MGRPPIPVGGTGEVRAQMVKDRLWRVRVRWRDDDGSYHRAMAEASSKRQCEELALQRIDTARQDLRGPQLAGLPLDEVAQRWFAAMEKSSRRPSTIAQYRATWRGTLSPILGQVGIDELDRATAQHVLHEGLFARSQGRRGADGTWIPGEYRRDADGHRIPLIGDQPRNVLRQLLRFAADRGYRADGTNPLDGTETPERRDPQVRAMLDDEGVRLIAMAEHWYRTGHGASSVLWHGLVTLRHTGLRLGELLALTWDDLDLSADPPTVTARQTLLEPRGGVTGLGPTKSGTVDIIALHPSAVDVLRSRQATETDGSSYVFATRSGRPVTQANFRRALRDLVRDTDLAWIHPHSFRHTVGTKAEASHDLEAARDLLRHAEGSTQVTRRHYVERNNVRVLDPRHLFENGQ